MTTWTSTDLAALEGAIKKGVKRVTYDSQTVEYHSLSEMLTLRDRMASDIAAAAVAAGGSSSVIYAGRR